MAPATSSRSASFDVSVGDLFRACFRHKWKMGVFFCVVMAMVAVYIYFGPRRYRSDAKLFLRLGRENVTLDPTATLGGDPIVSVPQFRENEINSVVEILSSRRLVEKVINSLGDDEILGTATIDGEPGESSQLRKLFTMSIEALDWRKLATAIKPDPPLGKRDTAIQKLGDSLSVNAVAKSNIVHISYDANTPERAQIILDEIIKAYLDEHIRINRTPGAHEFFHDQTARLKERLDMSEQRLLELQNETGIFAPLEQRQALINVAAGLEAELLTTEASMAAIEAEVKSMRETLESLPKTSIVQEFSPLANDATTGMRERVYALEIQEQGLLSKYTADHVEVQQVRKQIEAAKKILADEEATRYANIMGPSRAYQEVHISLLKKEPEYQALASKADKLKSQLASTREKMKHFNECERQMNQLLREKEVYTTSYQRYAESSEQAQIDRALEVQRISNVTVVQPATINSDPVAPVASLVLVLGLLCASSGAIGIALVIERLDRSLKTPEEIETSLDLPTLVSIPWEKQHSHTPNIAR